MSWTYSGDPSKTLKDAVRFTVADTKSDDGYVTDEEINWALSQCGQSVPTASALVARALSTQFATMSDEEIGPLKFKYAERSKNYALVADRLEGDANKATALTGIYGGGINLADKIQNEQDSSLVTPRLFRDQFKPMIVSSTDMRLSE
jgi:hypothetical protein